MCVTADRLILNNMCGTADRFKLKQYVQYSRELNADTVCEVEQRD
jgi:hypothetical protein